MGRICKKCGNTFQKNKVEIIQKNQPKNISLNVCFYCLEISSQDLNKYQDISRYTILGNPVAPEYSVSYENRKKINGWASSAYDHYLSARQSLISGRSIQGVTLATECLEKILKSVALIYGVDNNFFLEINHEPHKLAQKICEINPSFNGEFNKTFLDFLQRLYRLRYKPEDRMKYPENFHVVINDFQVLFELDKSVKKYRELFSEIVTEENQDYHQTVWDIQYNKNNLEISQFNLYLQDGLDFNDKDSELKYKEELINKIRQHCGGYPIMEFWVQQKGEDRWIREYTYLTAIRRSMYEPFSITKGKTTNQIHFQVEKKISEYINFIKVGDW